MSDCHESPVAPSPTAGRVAIAGNPNAGKTSIFNALTGSRQHVGNWPGKTVARPRARSATAACAARIVDLPGTYSLSAFSPEEVIARDYLLERRADVIVNVVDATNLERNLYLTAQLLELGLPLVVALNMSDSCPRTGHAHRHAAPRRAAGRRARRRDRRPPRRGLDELVAAALALVEPGLARLRRGRPSPHDAPRRRPALAPAAFRIDYGPDVEPEIDRPDRALRRARLRPRRGLPAALAGHQAPGGRG